MEIVSEVIEGTWEEIAQFAPKFNGHRLRVTILANSDEARVQETLAAQLRSKKARSAAAYLRERIAIESTDDPDEIREAKEELDELKRSMKVSVAENAR